MPSNDRSPSKDPHPILQASAAAGPIVFPGSHGFTEEARLRFASNLPMNFAHWKEDATSKRESALTLTDSEYLELEKPSEEWKNAIEEKLDWDRADSGLGLNSGWLNGEALDGKLDEFLYESAATKDTGERHYSGGGISIVAAHLDTRNAMVSATKAQLLPLESDARLPISRLQFFGCGQIGHELQWVKTDDGREIPSALCILFQSPTSFVHDVGVCLRIDLGTGNSLLAYFDRNEERVDKMLGKLSGPFVLTRSGNSTNRDNIWRWIAELLASYGESSDHWRVLLERQTRLMEGETGSRAHAYETGSGNLEHSFGRLTMAMPNANVSLVGLERVVQWQGELWAFLREMMLQADSLAGEVGGKIMSRKEKDGLLRTFDDAARECAAKRSQMEAVQKRMQVQISVLYSLVSQRDNRVNIELAQDSRKIAQAAKKDSKIMKVIAALTLIFLPATLISVS